MYQRILIIGRLGQDPEMRFTPQGVPVTTFSVATDRVWTDANGQRQQRTVWFRVSAWRRLAELCNQYLSKGRLVMVEGEIQEARPFQGRDGEWRATLEVTARDVRFLSARGEVIPAAEEGEAGPEEESGPILDEEEIPF